MQELSRVQDNKKSTGQANSNVIKLKHNASSKKARKHISAAGVFCVILILLLAGSVAAVYFDIGGSKQLVSSFLQLNAASDKASDPQASASQTELEAQTANLSKEREDLNSKKQELSTKESELTAKEQDISKREEAVTNAENQLKTDNQSEASLSASAKIFEQMDAAKAAKAIGGMKTTQEMSQVLLHMDSGKAALVMNQMDPKLATKILSEMVK